jgi:predicted glycosyltransferase
MKIILYSTLVLCFALLFCFITNSTAGQTGSAASNLSQKQSEALQLYGLAKECMRKHDYKQAEVNLKATLQIINKYRLTAPDKTDVVYELMAALEMQDKNDEATHVEHQNIIRSCVYVDNAQAFQQHGGTAPPHPAGLRPYAPAAVVVHRCEGRRLSVRQVNVRVSAPHVSKKRPDTHS